ncbi:hypothetical protein TSTA_110400 [Talaromyces stipitatus ATCC 10500]|uniref:DNA 3'-5' helicase n=1 Tax=Talaromyces stipitatus (strain ATCC 10500 / CBS 375.48 / QM 6759 / NRRL 1006) TaxID=441959 RepID=B8MUU0_TALSN|nr:uncharacterized protein TSTA_110400 [Talaromyces stipitatus ATCC 10500]EED11860.1 hypothetical protein TSTA_110400 [Talaromyces stipitatus ATCC 10500]
MGPPAIPTPCWNIAAISLLQKPPTTVPGSPVPEINLDRADKVQQAQRMIRDEANQAPDIQKKVLSEAIQLLYPYAPRSGQLHALFQLNFSCGDLILIVKTSFGKSMIPQALSILIDKTMTIVILSLIQIGAEQSECISRRGGRPLFLEKNTNKIGLMTDIKKEAYTRILLSPELSANPQMRFIFEESLINQRIAAVVIDEARLVHHWGDGFRPEYAQIGRLRIILGPRVPWFACSATLDHHTLKVLMERGNFKMNTVSGWGNTSASTREVYRVTIFI